MSRFFNICIMGNLCMSVSSLHLIRPQRSIVKTSTISKFQLNERINNSEENELLKLTNPLAMGFLVNMLLPVQDALAKNGEYGIFEGRTASMLHPLTMLALFGTSLYAASLGLQWRRLREIGGEIKSLNSQLPVLSSTGQAATAPIASTISDISSRVNALKSAADIDQNVLKSLQNDLGLLNGAKSIDEEIQLLSSTRKELLSKNLKDKHSTTGSWLLGAGVTVSLLGAFNTYMRAGKLFPGPHLYAGMAVTISWALAAALVPAMQKGNDAARTLHIALNVINIALFAWQVSTGLEIMIKVWGFTQWP